MRKRSELKKASAAERTEEIKSPPPGAECPECNETIEAGTATKRPDGIWECPHCAMPIEYSAGGVARTPPKKEQAKSGDTLVSSGATAAGKPLYCAKCGVRLTMASLDPASGTTPIDPSKKPKGMQPFFPCGHDGAGMVSDPSASEIQMANGAKPNPKKSPESPTTVTTDKPFTEERAERPPLVHYHWGRSMHRVAEFCTFDVGPFDVYEEVAPGETKLDAGRRARATCKQLADEDFDTKRRWYMEKMGLLK